MMKAFLLVLAFVAMASATTYFKETFDKDWESRWVISDWKKAAGTAGKFDVTAGDWYGDAEKDAGLRTSQDARFYAASAALPTEFDNEGKDLIIQFSAKHAQKIDCGGGYIKLLPAGLDQKTFNGDSKYNIMFGPDICGYTKKTHVIFTNKDGKNLLTSKDIKCEDDQLTHVYTLILKSDNTYEVRIDGEKKESGSLEEDFDFLEPKMIKDPEQSKPTDWVDEPMMDDPEDVKPEGYDDMPKMIADPEAEKPEDWSDEDDGEWDAPMIENPEYKGEWAPKRIANPDYKGEWVHPEIENPDYVADASLYHFPSSAFVGFELWQVKAGTIFDNIIVTDSVDEAEAFLAETFTSMKDAEQAMFDKAEEARKAEEEAERKRVEAERALEDEEDEDDEDDDDDYEDEDDVHDEL